MKVYAIETNSEQPKPAVRRFASKREAVNFGNGQIIFTSIEELHESPMSNAEMLRVYNAHSEAQPVARFSDRATAAKRLFSLAEAKAEEIQPAKEEHQQENTKVATKKEKAEGEAAGRGRVSKHAGKRYVASDEILASKDNPRRPPAEGNDPSPGYKSMQIIIDAGKRGIKFEDFIAAGGRINDLDWDIGHGSVVEKVKEDA